MKKQNSNRFSNIVSVLALLVALASLIAGIIQNQITIKRQEEFTLYLEEQAAIPKFRLSSAEDVFATIELFEPLKSPELISIGEGVFTMENYYSIRNFSIQNKAENLAYFSHIEYDGVAYELVNEGLFVEKDEVIRLSSANKFVGHKHETSFYFIVKSKYDKYYSYECSLRADGKDGDTYCYSVASISAPIEYDIDNEIYKNMHKHVRGVTLNYDNIIF